MILKSAFASFVMTFKVCTDKKSNYRPISILPPYSKIIEILIYKQINNYLVKYSILSEDQFGSKDQPLFLYNFFKLLVSFPSIDDGQSVFLIFLDFSKAFGFVDYFILLKKLQFYEFRGLFVTGLNHTCQTANNMLKMKNSHLIIRM